MSKSLKHVLSPLLGKRDLVSVLLVHLFFVFFWYWLVFVIFSFSWCLGLAVVCDCGTPWTFLLTGLKDSNQTIGKTTEFIFYYFFLNMNTVNSLNLTFNTAQNHTRYSVKRDLTSRVFIA